MQALLAFALVLAIPTSDVPPTTPNAHCVTAELAGPEAELAGPEEDLITPIAGPSGLEALLADGATLADAATGSAGLTSCPAVFTCGGGPNTTCVSTGCSTIDTGETACQGGSFVLHCPDGKTLHITSCSCLTLQARCCTGPPPNCLCVNCNSSSQSISCQ